MTLTTRLAIAMILLVAIAVAAVGLLSYWSVEQAVLPHGQQWLSREPAEVHVLKARP